MVYGYLYLLNKILKLQLIHLVLEQQLAGVMFANLTLKIKAYKDVSLNITMRFLLVNLQVTIYCNSTKVTRNRD